MFSTHVDSIKLTEYPITDDTVCEIAEQHGAYLKTADLRGADVSDVALKCLASHATALTTVKLAACHNITSSGLRKLAKRCGKTLTDVNLSETNMSPECLAFFIKHCPQLTRLSLYSLSCVPGALSHLNARYHPHLTSLDLTLCTTLGDTHLAKIVQNCPNLIHLNIGWTSLSDKSLATMAEYSHNLSKLCLMGCRKITDAGISDVIRGCTHLHSLNLGWTNISNTSLVVIAEHAKNLATLRLTGCMHLTDEGLYALLRCQTLQKVYIQQSEPFSLSARAKIQQTRPHLLEYF